MWPTRWWWSSQPWRLIPLAVPLAQCSSIPSRFSQMLFCFLTVSSTSSFSTVKPLPAGASWITRTSLSMWILSSCLRLLQRMLRFGFHHFSSISYYCYFLRKLAEICKNVFFLLAEHLGWEKPRAPLYCVRPHGQSGTFLAFKAQSLHDPHERWLWTGTGPGHIHWWRLPPGVHGAPQEALWLLLNKRQI